MTDTRKTIILVSVAAIICVCESKSPGTGSVDVRGAYQSGNSYRTSSTRYANRLPDAYNVRGWGASKKSSAIISGTIHVTSRVQRYYFREVLKTYSDDLLKYDVCRNIDKFPALNASEKVYGWFYCPTTSYQFDEKFCCGSEDVEYCCAYWRTSNGVRDICLGTFGGAIIITILAIFLYKNPQIARGLVTSLRDCFCCCCNRHKKEQDRRLRNEVLRRRAENQRQQDEAQHTPINSKEEKEIGTLPPSYEVSMKKDAGSTDDIQIGFQDGKQ